MRRSKNRRIAALAVAVGMVAAGLAGAETALFVNSAPILAEVTINGTAAGTTPLLVRDVEPGEYEVRVVKRGFVPAVERITVGPDEIAVVDVRPEPDVFVGAFSADETIVNGERFERQDATLVLPSGTYSLSANDNSLRLDAFYPNEGALQAARIVTFGAGIAAIVSTLEDVLVRGEATSYFTSFLPSPGTIATWAITFGAGGYWIALESEKRSYEERMIVERFAGTLTPADAERFYNQGEVALAAGNLSRAIENYSRVVADGGDSEYVPDALYKTAQIYSISGDTEIAERLFELLISHYPAPLVYDRALRSLAEIARDEGQFGRAVEALERILFVDDTYTESEIQEEIETIRAEARE